MWFIVLLLILFLLYYFAPRLMMAALRYFMRRQVEKMFGGRQAAGSKSKRGTSGSGGRGNAYGESSPGQRRKKIDGSVGEYVAFTELPPDPDKESAEPVSFTAESQIEDAEWTEL